MLNFESYVFKSGIIDACYYNTSLGHPCHQGNIPILGVEAQKVSDIQATVKFVKKHNLRLIIKNTGYVRTLLSCFLGPDVICQAMTFWVEVLAAVDSCYGRIN